MPKATFDDFVNSFPAFKELGFDKSSCVKELFDQLSKDVRIEMAVDASDEGVPALSASLGLIEEYVEYELRLGSKFVSDGYGVFNKLRMFGEKIMPLRKKIFTINGRDYDYDRVNFIMQAFIKMQGFILEPFGYFPNGIEKPLYGEIFQTAPCYEFVEGKAAMPVPRVIEYKTDRSEDGLRKAFLEEGDMGAMFELFQLYGRTGRKDKSRELMRIYMDRGYYSWIDEANEARRTDGENHQDDYNEN